MLEIIGFTLEGCKTAQAAGAGRIELCDNAADGGTTPSYGFIKAARKLLHIPLYVMIRPRGGDFLYSDEEFDMMQSDIRLCKELGSDGVVLGLLQANGAIDKERTSRLVELAYPLGVTFHRAFDRCNDPLKALEDITLCGCERILTSGQQATAAQGATLIRMLVEKAAHNIIIMPGSGINSSNIAQLAQATGAVEFHSSARTMVKTTMQYISPGFEATGNITSTDEREIVNMLAALKTAGQ
ncbi:MAG TPA: copper homeostasis protein CutC [Ferruginibacter sp.]|nr:copper homeostasis protein CutC [Ferruginibacter sp.]HMP21166.1 copper homeostasis protein CutC [Ferruginibacter sp.]